MNISFTSSLIWHKRFLSPIAEELIRRGYTVKTSYDKISYSESDTVVTAYHEDLKNIKNAKIKIFTEHCVSAIKSSYAHLDISKYVDYVLVQGPVFSQWLKFNHPKVEQLKTGWCRIEDLYHKKSTREQIIKKHNLNSQKPIIIYAPTWDSLSKPPRGGTMNEAYPIFKKLNIENLLILPHPSCYYAHNIFNNEKPVILNEDIYFYLLGCDLLIGDNSSVLIEFTVLNKPIIQLNKWNDLDHFISWYPPSLVFQNTNASEFRNLFGVFQVGEIVPIEESAIVKGISDALSCPNKYKIYREYWKNISFYNLGNSLKTTVDAVEGITK